jgi:DNA-binding MarR family transcriptional regulator
MADIQPPVGETEILAFLAAHPLGLATHIETLIDADEHAAHERLDKLQARGLIARTRVTVAGPGCWQITPIGLAIADSSLPPPGLRLDDFRHDLGVAWVYLAALRAAFGRAEHVLSEREQRSRDAHPPSTADTDARVNQPLGVRVIGGAVDTSGLHYPDVLLIGARGEHVAIELAQTSNGQRHLETTMTSYRADPRIDAVLYLAEDPAIRHAIHRAAAGLGTSDLIHVQTVSRPQTRPTTSP